MDARECRSLSRSEEHTSELQSPCNLVCRLLLGKKKQTSELQSPCNSVCRLLVVKKKEATLAYLCSMLMSRVLSVRLLFCFSVFFFFFFNDTATTEIYTLSLHDALPISSLSCRFGSFSYIASAATA